MDWLQFAVQWLHVLFGIFWFGAVLYADFILIPALQTLPLVRQREIGSAIGARARQVILSVAGLTIVLGLIRGTVFGPIKSLDALGTTYGLTWLVALVAAVATFYWGLRVLVPAIARLDEFGEADALGTDGRPSGLTAVIDDIKRKSGLELIGFVIIFTCMILMRFGL